PPPQTLTSGLCPGSSTSGVCSTTACQPDGTRSYFPAGIATGVRNAPTTPPLGTARWNVSEKSFFGMGGGVGGTGGVGPGGGVGPIGGTSPPWIFWRSATRASTATPLGARRSSLYQSGPSNTHASSNQRVSVNARQVILYNRPHEAIRTPSSS